MTDSKGLTFRALQNAVDQRAAHIDPENKLGPLFFATEFGGESGEAQNVVKKLERERLGIAGSRDTIAHLGAELADVIITACNLARQYDIDLDSAIRDTFNAVSEVRGLPVTLPAHPPTISGAGDLVTRLREAFEDAFITSVSDGQASLYEVRAKFRTLHGDYAFHKPIGRDMRIAWGSGKSLSPSQAHSLGLVVQQCSH